MTVSADALTYLRLYTPQTHGMNLPGEVADELTAAGFIEWLPPTGWSGTIYGLTEAGRTFVEGLPAEPVPFAPYDSVIYRPSYVTDNGWDPETCLFHGEERGIVKRIQGDTVFVWFGGGDTAAAVHIGRLHADTREARAPAWYNTAFHP